MRKYLLRATVLGLLLALFVGAAQAHVDSISDPNDTAGDLDIKKVIVHHDADFFVWKVKTFAPFSTQLLDPPGAVNIFVKRLGDRFWFIRVENTPGGEPGEMTASITPCSTSEGCNSGDQSFGRAKKTNSDTLRVKVRRSKLPGVGETLRYRVESLNDNGCGGEPCKIDSAPDSGYAPHPL